MTGRQSSILTRQINEEEILKAVLTAKNDFGVKCPKSYTGVVTIEYLRRALAQQGITTSATNVFIEGISIEIDLVVPKKGAVPRHGVLYKPDDVLAAFEVKNRGVFDKDASSKIHNCFTQIQAVNSRIWCAYVTLSEQKGFKKAVMDYTIGFPAYTFFWHFGVDHFDATGDWQRFVRDLTTRTGQTRGKANAASC